jgi:predicted transcriptional regulator
VCTIVCGNLPPSITIEGLKFVNQQLDNMQKFAQENDEELQVQKEKVIVH